MKKTLLALFCALTAVTAFGQGQAIFTSSGGTAITNVSTGARAIVSTVVGFYANVNSNALPSDPGWVLAGGTTNLTAPGLYVGGTRTFAGFPAGTMAAFQVRAWLTSGNFTSYEAATSGEALGFFGQSIVLRFAPQVSPTPIPTALANGMQAFTIQSVPEPSSIALGLLGLGAIALFRRKK